jgi:hypothetical protein
MTILPSRGEDVDGDGDADDVATRREGRVGHRATRETMEHLKVA